MMIAAAIVIMGFSALAADNEKDSRADDIKAVFVYKFTGYITWPEDDDKPFTIAILGKTSLLEPLKTIAEKKTVDTRPLLIRECSNVDDVSGANILLIAETMEKHLEAILKKAEEENILTVGSSPGLAKKGVAINFCPMEDRIGFEMNLNALKRSGLGVSSQLVKLAKLVEEDRPRDAGGELK